MITIIAETMIRGMMMPTETATAGAVCAATVTTAKQSDTYVHNYYKLTHNTTIQSESDSGLTCMPTTLFAVTTTNTL